MITLGGEGGGGGGHIHNDMYILEYVCRVIWGKENQGQADVCHCIYLENVYTLNKHKYMMHYKYMYYTVSLYLYKLSNVGKLEINLD